jgi:hypothetical protein
VIRIRCSAAASIRTGVVIEPLQRRLLIQRPDLVPDSSQPLANSRTGDVRVQEEPHPG